MYGVYSNSPKSQSSFSVPFSSRVSANLKYLFTTGLVAFICFATQNADAFRSLGDASIWIVQTYSVISKHQSAATVTAPVASSLALCM